MFRTHSQSRDSQRTTRGLTLIEMLISMAVTLLMMAAVVSLFANVGAGVRNRRAGMELGSQLRLARARLFKDLAGATSAARPKLKSDDHQDGYLEIVEGLYSDKNPTGLTLLADTIIPGSQINPTDASGLGDYDDILALTVRSESEPFVGRRTVLRQGGDPNVASDWIEETIESDLAEVIWYAVENPAGATNSEPGMRTVYRRVLLIAPWIGSIDLNEIKTTNGTPILQNDESRFFQRFDISARYDNATNLWIPNTLSDLTKRENRFAHFNPTNTIQVFPHSIRLNKLRIFPSTDTTPLHPFGQPYVNIDSGYDDPDRRGEDVMLNDVLAFDLRVFDPGAPIRDRNGVTLEPSDPGWDLAPTLVSQGAFVDLCYLDEPPRLRAPIVTTPIPTSLFSSQPSIWYGTQLRSLPFIRAVYDTWPYHYEDDGVDQDGDGVDTDGDGKLDANVDEGTDGLDNDNANGVDDSLERETAPPYDTPLRGMQAKIRVYERETRQVREATVTRNFVPQ